MIKTQIMIPATVAILAAGCGASDDLLDSTESVCHDFAVHAKAGLPADERPGVVDRIGEVIANADEGLRSAYPALERTADANDSAYLLAADAFAQACFDAGWDG